jgi:hypothetical protein
MSGDIMKKNIIILILMVAYGHLGLALSIDLKTKFAEKPELMAIKLGATYFLEKKGFLVTDIGEDFAVWLKDLEQSYVAENQYAYKITVKLSFPTAFIEKATIMEENLHFEIRLNIPLKNVDNRLENQLEKHFSKVKERLKYEAYIGGMAVATCIEELLIAKGVLRKK